MLPMSHSEQVEALSILYLYTKIKIILIMCHQVRSDLSYPCSGITQMWFSHSLLQEASWDWAALPKITQAVTSGRHNGDLNSHSLAPSTDTYLTKLSSIYKIRIEKWPLECLPTRWMLKKQTNI